jgi:hypothetical protein
MRKMLLASFLLTFLVAHLFPPMGTTDSFPGEVVMIASGACPSGFSESSALNGNFPRGTINANGDVGGTGGADTVTPAGTISQPTFSGAQGTTSATSAGTPAGTNGSTTITSASTEVPVTSPTKYVFSTLNSSAAASSSPSITIPAETFTGSALATHTHTLTPSGTVSTPTFSGSSFDNRPAFVKVIFCVKN